MAVRTCRVTCSDTQGVERTVEVTAQSLYEAVAQALRVFREDDWGEDPNRIPASVVVTINQPQVEHRVRIKDFAFDQVNDFLPQDVSSPTDLRSVLESFQDMDIKILADVPEDELEAGVKEGPDETAEPAPAADSIGESSDPVRLYLKEMGNFQLLSRERKGFEPSTPYVANVVLSQLNYRTAGMDWRSETDSNPRTT